MYGQIFVHFDLKICSQPTYDVKVMHHVVRVADYVWMQFV